MWLWVQNRELRLGHDEQEAKVSDLYNKNMCHRFAVEQILCKYEFALLALARCHAHQWKAGVCN